MNHHVAQNRRSSQILLAATAYFGIVFGVGFMLGAARVPFLVPRFGVRFAELAEMPLMFVAIFLASGFVVRRFGSSITAVGWLIVGATSLALMVAAELLLAVALAGRGIEEYIASRDPVSGSAYLAMLLVFGVMPLLRRGLGKAPTM
jgi:hypothetical protein